MDSQYKMPDVYISIHASIKDATLNLTEQGKLIRISIHASIKDATGMLVDWWNANSISIHASIKDATNFWSKS